MAPTAFSWKRMLAGMHDVIVAGLAFLIALVARYGFEDVPTDERLAIWLGTLMVIAAIIFRIYGLGRGIWRFSSITDLRAIVLASTTTIITFLVVTFILQRLEGLPRTTLIITWFVMIVLIGAPRLFYRLFKDGGFMSFRPGDFSPEGVEHLLILGNATESDRLIRTYNLEASRRFRVCGIVDHGARKQGRLVRGIPIVGQISDLEDIVQRFGRRGTRISSLIIATSGSNRSELGQLAAVASRLRIRLMRVGAQKLDGMEPSLEDVTLDDLLGRPPVVLDTENIRDLISGSVVLVTGAGGSIGSEICKQVAGYGPARIILLDHSEYALYEVDQLLMCETPQVPRRAIISDVRDMGHLSKIFAEERPRIVFHAAALKQVPLVEQNVCEGALTNLIGSRNVADCAVAHGTEVLVVISTDKAIRPSSVMGATKRAAELYCQALDISDAPTRFITVRFGNVLGSTGSVVPLFKRQILAGGPVTVTHPDMKRYFMTIREATELVLQAATLGTGPQVPRGKILVLDMGEPVRIVDLARTMIALSGLRPGEDVAIEFTGLRPGEKLFEELFDPEEGAQRSEVDGVFIANARITSLSEIRPKLAQIETAALARDSAATRRLLRAVVTGEPVDAVEPPAAGNVVKLNPADISRGAPPGWPR